MITASRSVSARSSAILPGHGNAASSVSAARENVLSGMPFRRHASLRKCVASSGNVFGSLTKRRQLDPHDAQGFDEIGAQVASPDPVVDPRGRAGDQAQVAQTTPLRRLMISTSSRCAVRGQLVRSPRDRRSFPGTHPRRICAREIDAVRATLDLDERLVAMRTLPMNRPRHRLTAGAALAQHQHVAAARRDAPHQREHFADRRRGAEHAAGGELDARGRFRLGGPRRRVRELAARWRSPPSDRLREPDGRRDRRCRAAALRKRRPACGDRRCRRSGFRRAEPRAPAGTSALQGAPRSRDHDEAGLGLALEDRPRLRALLDLGHGMAAALEHFRHTFALSARGRDQQDWGRDAHFTGTCLVYAPEASGWESIAINVPPA